MDVCPLSCQLCSVASINDLKRIKTKHPALYKESIKGHFSTKKINRKFSGTPDDQAHEQNNKLVKIDGGAV